MVEKKLGDLQDLLRCSFVAFLCLLVLGLIILLLCSVESAAAGFSCFCAVVLTGFRDFVVFLLLFYLAAFIHSPFSVFSRKG